MDWINKNTKSFLLDVLGGGVVCFAADVPDGRSCNRAGAAVRALAERGVIAPCGFTRSPKPSRRGGAQRLWRLADGTAAHRVLEDLDRDDPQLELSLVDN